MNRFYFNDRKGNTVLSAKELKGLKLTHITTLTELDEAEQMNINEGLLWLSKYTGDILSESFMHTLHKKLFGKVWKWAGTYRTTEKNIGIDYWMVSTEMKKLIEDLKYWLENNTYPPAELLAHVHHRMVYIHPFPNGNGRFSRIYVELLCDRYGFEKPDWYVKEEPEQRRHRYITALQQADVKKYKPLVEYMKHTASSQEVSL
jgi:Fic-DOC domain mobile mystery protein B